MSESKELTVPERAAVALGTAEHEKALLVLATKYSDITKIVNTAGRDQVHAGYMELKNARVAIKKAGETAREDANLFQRAVIAEVERLTAITADEETRLQTLRDDFDAEREREKAAKAAAEAERIRSIKARIERFMLDAVTASDMKAADIDAHATRLSEMVISLDEFNEFSGEAQMKRDDTVKWLRERQHQAEQREAEAQRLAEERAALEAERRAQAERDKQIREARELDERLAHEARERAAEKQRAEHEAAEAKLKAEREAAEAELRKQREEIARQQAEINAVKAEQERAERARLAAIEAEEQRKREEMAAEAQKAERERKEREREENLAARNAPQPTGGTWSVGEHGLTVVTTDLIAGCPGTGHNDAEYYGGNLICESVWRPADAHVIAAAREMFDLLTELIDIEGPCPGDVEWYGKVQAVLAKATYVPEIQPEAQAA